MLSEIDNKIVIKGTYEDESYDPSGAFIYAGTSYSNMEDLDEIYNQEKAFEDDFYNEKWQDKLFKLEQEFATKVGWLDFISKSVFQWINSSSRRMI